MFNSAGNKSSHLIFINCLKANELKAVSKNVHIQVGAEAPSDEDLDNMVEQLGGSVDFDTFAAFVIPVILEAFGVTAE
jgi:hypothetical protein